MKVLGQYDTKGKYLKYKEPIEVNQFGDRLIDKDFTCWAVKDEYGDWVSPTMKNLGLKSKIKVTI